MVLEVKICNVKKTEVGVTSLLLLMSITCMRNLTYSTKPKHHYIIEVLRNCIHQVINTLGAKIKH